MTNEELDELLYKIEEADPNEQLILAVKLIEELKVNNKLFDEYEYNAEKSEEYVKEISTLSQKLKEKIEMQKNNSLIKRYNKLNKSNQKKVLDEISKIISTIENKKFIEQCYKEEHSFTEWEKQINIIPKIKKNDNGEKRLIDLKIPYWTRKCTKCGYEEEVEKEPNNLIKKRNEEMIKKRIKTLKEELALLEELN